MEIRNFWMIALDPWTDDMMKLSYIKILTSEKFETIKLPTSINLYKHSHLISPENILHVEVVKTKKNWVLKNILEYKKIAHPKTYLEYTRLAYINKVLQNYFHENQDAQILDYVIKVLSSSKLNKIDIKLFENDISRRLGFH